MYDVIIIGAGVSGCAAARELSRYKLRVCVLEKESDVCCGTSKANSGLIHAGFDASAGSLMAKLNVRGNEMMEQLSKDLSFPFIRNGALVICRDQADMPGLHTLYERGIKNGVKQLRILNREEVLSLEPNITDQVYAALYAPTAGMVCPFELNIALAENAYTNGVDFYFDTEVAGISKEENIFSVYTANLTFRSKCIINAAGVYADRIHNMISRRRIKITARKGEYCLLDKNTGSHVKHTVFSLPGKYGKGILVTPTVHGNLLLGPTATDTEDKESTDTTAQGLSEVLAEACKNVKDIPLSQVITSFAGLRAHEADHEFIIREAEDVPGFIDCAGIESPGLSSCPAIGEMTAGIAVSILHPEPDPSFCGIRKGILNPRLLTPEEWDRLIRDNPAYGRIICRCEMISEGEIIDAIRRPLGARTIDGIKRRTRAGMGRCQSGFCLPGTMEILARELKTDLTGIRKSGAGSKFIKGGAMYDGI